MATFNGLDLGGVAVPLVVPAPRRRQVNAYPGVNGQEWLDMGSDGGAIVVSTLLYADNVSDLNTIELIWYGYQFAGTAHLFVDNFGNPIPGVILDLYEPIAPVGFAADGGVTRQARFRFIFPI